MNGENHLPVTVTCTTAWQRMGGYNKPRLITGRHAWMAIPKGWRSFFCFLLKMSVMFTLLFWLSALLPFSLFHPGVPVQIVLWPWYFFNSCIHGLLRRFGQTVQLFRLTTYTIFFSHKFTSRYGLAESLHQHRR